MELFNDSTAEFRPVVTLPDQKTVTGEEEESVAFTGAPPATAALVCICQYCYLAGCGIR